MRNLNLTKELESTNKAILRFRKTKDLKYENFLTNELSFGVFKLYSDQKELRGYIDVSFLRKKYNDNSLTNNKVISSMNNHIFDKYGISCFVKLKNKEIAESERIKKLWYKYTNNDGFCLVYDMQKVSMFINKKRKTGCYEIKEVKYSNKKIDLTFFIDSFLSLGEDIETNIDLLYNIILLNNKAHIISDYMSTKTLYSDSFENEIRIIKKIEDEVVDVSGHFKIDFIKPSKVFALAGSDSNNLIKIRNMCALLGISFEIVKNDEVFKV